MPRGLLLTLLVATQAAILLPSHHAVVPMGQSLGQRDNPPKSQGPAGTGAIAGSLIAADSGRPVRMARVTLAETRGAAAVVNGQRMSLHNELDDKGRFTFLGVAPGTYRVEINRGPMGWFAKSVSFGGRDALDFMLDVKPGEDRTDGVLTFARQMAGVSGSVTDHPDHTTSDCTIILFASDSKYWLPHSRRVRATRPTSNGHFTIGDLPAGEYRLAVVRDLEPGEWDDPAYLRSLVAASIPVTLGDGERRVQDLRIDPSPPDARPSRRR